MSVLIKGMKMPENCFHCRFSRWDVEGGFCDLLNEDADMRFKRHDDCPLIEVPDHGDLIERDRLHHDLKADAIDKFALLDDTYLRYLEGLEKAEELLLGATVVIPAERSDDE